LVLKDQDSDEPIMQEELSIASRQKVLDPRRASKFVEALESKTENICAAFHKQAVKEAVFGGSSLLKHTLSTTVQSIGPMGSSKI
jgi:hypothetical protein